MQTTVYLHPLKTVAMKWIVVGGVHSLVDYAELDPLGNGLTKEKLEATLGEWSRTPVLIIHSSSITTHSFPVEDGESISDRLEFELKEFQPSAIGSTVRLIAHHGVAYDSAWVTACIISNQVKQDISALFGADADLTTDIEVDLDAARLDENGILVGMRGDKLWAATIDGYEAPFHLDCVPLKSNSPVEVQIEELVTEHISSLQKTWNVIRVFGDNVKPDLINKLAASPIAAGRSVQRLNSFRHVRTVLSAEQQDTILRRAHLLSALVGAATRSSKQLSKLV